MPETVSETETLRLSLPLIIANQAQKHLTLNEGLERLDLFVQTRALSRTLSVEPASPVEGDTYIRPATATGTHWAGFSAYHLMRFTSGAWEAITAPEGMIAYVADEAGFVVRTVTDWVRLEARINSLDELGHLGINTTADSDNVISVKGPAALISAQYISDGGSGDVSVALNKESAGGTAQILWQTAFGSQMILGLLGSNDLSLKSSTDGARFVEALRFDHRSGRAHFIAPPYRRPNRHQASFVASQSWLTSTSAADNDWQAVCYAPEPGLFVVIAGTGSGNRVMTSPDAVVWTTRTSAADNDWRGVVWAAELSLFVAVSASGSGNRVMTSPDGSNWTIRLSAADLAWQSLAWSRECGRFVAVAASGTGHRVMTSPDGLNWTTRTSAADNDWKSVVWAAELGLFAAVAATGTGSRVMTSPDGLSWTTRTSAADNDWQALAYAPELKRLVAVASTGTGNRVMTSDDGINWTIRVTPADLDWRAITFAPEIGLFAAVAASGTGNRVMTSPDGINWNPGTSAADQAWQGLTYAAETGLFCAVASTGAGSRIMTSRSALAAPYRS